MRGSVTIVVLVGIIGALIIALARQGGTPNGMIDGDITSLIVKTGVAILVGGAVTQIYRDRFGQAIQAAMVFAIIGLALVAGYTYRIELRDVGDRILSELVPGRAVARGRTVELARTRAGDFQVGTQVNGARVAMVLDTGASAVVLTYDAAVAAGLPVEMIKYTVNIDTANGRAQAGAVTLDRIAIGNIVERGVPALIAPPGQLKVSLLGMSFLSRLQSWEVRGDRISMRGGT